MDRIGRREVLAAGAGVAAAGLAGCSGGGDGEDDPSDRGPIAVEEFAFATGRPSGYREFESQPDATYAPDDVIWIYVDFSGLSGEPVVEPDDDGDEDGGSENGGSENGGSTDSTGSDANGTGDGDDSAVRIDLGQHLTVEDPEGAVAVESEETFRRTLSARQLDGFYVGNDVLLAGSASTGEYAVTLTYADHVSETDVTAEGTFTIVA